MQNINEETISSIIHFELAITATVAIASGAAVERYEGRDRHGALVETICIGGKRAGQATTGQHPFWGAWIEVGASDGRLSDGSVVRDLDGNFVSTLSVE